MFYYKCPQDTESPDWIKNKRRTINPKNIDDECFQYVATVALNFDEIKKDPQRVSNIKSFISKYNWDRIKCPSKIDDWKTIQQLLLMFCILKKWKYVLIILLTQIVENK